MPVTLGSYAEAEPFNGTHVASVFLICVALMAIVIFIGALAKMGSIDAQGRRTR